MVSSCPLNLLDNAPGGSVTAQLTPKAPSLLVREEGSATRSVTERALQRVKFRVAMELDHTEAIKQGVMAGLGVAFVSLYAVQGEIAAGRLRALRLRGVRIRRHFHVIHHEARRITASARAFMQLFEQTARERRRGLNHSKGRDHPPVHQNLQQS